MSDQSIRFVVGSTERHSLSWNLTVTTKPDGSEIYIFPREISTDYHVSLHKSGDWHVRVGEREALELGFHPDELKGPAWTRPKELAPGVTLALRIVTTPSAISRTHPVSKSGRCLFIPAPAGDRSVEVSILITSAPPTADSWVGRRSMGTRLLGFLPLAGNEWVVAVWRDLVTPRPAPVHLSMSAAKRLGGDASVPGAIGAMLWMIDADGAPCALVGRFDDESATRFREKWVATAPS